MATDGECSTPGKGATVRSHSEAERKRRQRINAHLATLRTLVPSASRMDKAALLGEVVRHVRELQGRANDATEGVVDVVPGETDEVGVEEDDCLLNRGPTHDVDDDDPRWRRRVRAWANLRTYVSFRLPWSVRVLASSNRRPVSSEQAEQ
uniref:Putative transcription factor bHLH107 n=1 Tax=Aegilops tauschii TaxID=37682 RepID=M8B1U2_AEGTA